METERARYNYFSTRQCNVPSCHYGKISGHLLWAIKVVRGGAGVVSRNVLLTSYIRKWAICLRQPQRPAWLTDECHVKADISPSTPRRAAPYLPLLRPHLMIQVSKACDSRQHRAKRQRLHAPPSWSMGLLLARLKSSRLQFLCVKPKVVATCNKLHRLVHSRLVSSQCL